MDELNRIYALLTTLRVPRSQDEFELHQTIAASLREGGFLVEHEAKIGPRCRIDFRVDGAIGIEVKRGRPARGRLLAQLKRYLECDSLAALILVVEANVTVPSTIAGKPVRVLSLNRLWGVALP